VDAKTPSATCHNQPDIHQAPFSEKSPAKVKIGNFPFFKNGHHALHFTQNMDRRQANFETE